MLSGALGALAAACAPRRPLKTDGTNPRCGDGDAAPTTFATERARIVQGGHLILSTEPSAEILLDGKTVGSASGRGLAVIGFDRDAPAGATVMARAGSRSRIQHLAIAPGSFDVQRVNGLPSDTVTPSDPALLARIARESALKRAAFASVWDGDAFAGGFVPPVEARVSSRFGNQRILNGTAARPHYGVDLACPTGTPVRAPASGLVVLAEPDLHFEGGLVLIDHGQGLVSAYLHLSQVDVPAGRIVASGERIGAVGAKGRATGPHLCWRLKWRDRNLDPSLLLV